LDQLTVICTLLNKLTISIFLCVVQACTSQSRHLPPSCSISYYLLTFDKDDIREVKVEAILPLVTDSLYMSQSEYEPLKDGYATFVHDLKASDSKGNKVSLASIGNGIWKIEGPHLSSIKISYGVTIGHDHVQWNTSAAFAHAYSVDHVVFFAGRTMFIAPTGEDSAKINVQYALPKDWDVASPYTDLKNTSNTFEAQNLADLWHNGNFVGEFVKQEINAGNLKVVIAGTPSMHEGVELFKSALDRIVNSYKAEMGGAPGGKLVIMGSVTSAISPGGEAFKRSISVMFSQPPDMSNKGRWGYLLAHEVFHLWNGQAISPLNQSQVEWFVEGFTEYMSKLSAYRTGFISEAEFLQQLAYCHYGYFSNAGKISLVEAGLHKGSNYDLIYTGGMSVALSLYIQIRKATQNKKSFIYMMKLMYSKFGKNNKPYNYEDIIIVSSAFCGIDLSGFFKKYVSGTEVIPLDTYLGYAGLELTTGSQIAIKPNLNAAPAEKELLKGILAR
jgi:predicted metalloprotease with PDZ domain